MGRAEHFLILSSSRPEYKEQACMAAAKACGDFPLSIYFYDFGCILQQVAKPDEAKQMLPSFCGARELKLLTPSCNQRCTNATLRKQYGTHARWCSVSPAEPEQRLVRRLQKENDRPGAMRKSLLEDEKNTQRMLRVFLG